jgi:hypothetical protein
MTTEKPTSAEAQVKDIRAIAIKMAQGHLAKMRADKMNEGAAFKYVVNIMNGADVVFGVWPDPKCPGGYDMIVVRGMHLIAECSIGSKAMEFSIDALPCECGERAAVAEAHFKRLN